MTHFIKVEKIYNHQTGQGEGCKLINIDQIRHVTDWSKSKFKHRKGINTIIQLLNGEIFHTGDTLEEINDQIKNCQKATK